LYRSICTLIRHSRGFTNNIVIKIPEVGQKSNELRNSNAGQYY
jgi:hypothetical protein